MRNDDEERLEGIADEQLAEIDSFCSLTDKTMRSVLAQGKASSRWSEVIDTVMDWCFTLGYEVEANDPSFPLLIRSFAKVEKEAQARISLRNEGEDTETPAPPRAVGYKLSDVVSPFEEYKSTSSGKKHLGTTLNAWKLLIEHCGDVALDGMTAAHIYDFMLDRLHAAHKPWSEQRAKSFGKRTLREIFGFARTRGLMTVPNPVDALEVFPTLSKADEASRKKPRHPFNSSQLNTFFSSEWYDPYNSNQFRGKMREDLGARYWVPLIGLFHGNRVSEALQLVASDFSSETGVFTVSFRVELEAGTEQFGKDRDSHTGLSESPIEKFRSLKNSSTRRVVPVHPELLKLGFEVFVAARRKDGPNALLFPSSLPSHNSAHPKLGRAYEQAFLRFVRDHLKFGHGFGSHSFRHQLEDRLRATQVRDGTWPAGLGHQYTGRKRTRAIDRGVFLEEGSEAYYGDGYSPRAMLKYIEKIDFSDVILPQPFSTWHPPRNRK